MNLHAFVSGDPANLSDPSGLKECDPLIEGRWGYHTVMQGGESRCVRDFDYGGYDPVLVTARRDAEKIEEERFFADRPSSQVLLGMGLPLSSASGFAWGDKQLRVYGPNGLPKFDVDWGHPGHQPGVGSPHVHDWDGVKRLPMGRAPGPGEIASPWNPSPSRTSRLFTALGGLIRGMPVFMVRPPCSILWSRSCPDPNIT